MWDYAYAAKPRMTEVFRNNIYNVAINTIFPGLDDLRTCLLWFPDNTFGSNEFTVFTALRGQCEDELCRENLFSIALIAGIIQSGLVHRYTVPKMYIKGIKNGRYIIEKYNIRTSGNLIDLPNGIFNKLNNDFYLKYVRPFVPQRYQDSKYGYR